MPCPLDGAGDRGQRSEVTLSAQRAAEQYAHVSALDEPIHGTGERDGVHVPGVVLAEGGQTPDRQPGRMIGAIAQREDAEEDQRGDLYDVDGDVDGGGSASALLRDPCDEEGEDDGDQGHEDRAGDGAEGKIHFNSSHDIFIPSPYSRCTL